jgi:hypothetical protein
MKRARNRAPWNSRLYCIDRLIDLLADPLRDPLRDPCGCPVPHDMELRRCDAIIGRYDDCTKRIAFLMHFPGLA